jgi:hypothetical protein
VKSLEGGTIRSIDAQIEQVVGGDAKCKTIKAGVLRGKACLQAATQITIGQVNKGENRLIIDASVEDEDRAAIDEAIAAIAELRAKIDENRRAREANALYLSKNLSAFKQVQETIAADRALGRLTGETYLNMAREYKVALKKQDDADAQIELLTTKIKEKRRELERFDKMALESVVVSESAIWAGHNEVIFRLPFLGREFVQNIDDGMRVKRVKLVESDDDGGYEIKLFY